MNHVSRLKVTYLTIVLATIVVALAGTSISAAQGLVYDFPNVSGDARYPGGALTQGRDGNLYGVSNTDDQNNYGTIYMLTPAGVETGLHHFLHDGTEGTYCSYYTSGAWGLTLASDGNFYGACEGGGTASNFCGGDYGCGTVYKITPDGTFTVLHSFLGAAASEGSSPLGPLTEGADGNLYGVTYYGGTSSTGSGTVYKITKTGTLTTVHSFSSVESNGVGPAGALFLSSDGNFYGTATAGGSGGYGTVFKITTKGKITVLHNFTQAATDGGTPTGGVIQGADNSLYGATYFGGTSSEGTLFKVTTSKKFTLLHSFDLAADYGILPTEGVIQATDGNIYGVTTSYAGGGYANNGSAYEFNTAKKGGGFSVLFDFGGAVYPLPDSPFLNHTNGLLYGSTYQGGQYSLGLVYSVDRGLKPYIAPQSRSGKIGTSVNILGQGFSSATHVAFNGTSATFAAVSDTFMTATIPTGSTTGFVTVTESGGTLQSNFKFKVKP
jgi:uncharacterized repeat protein (TIGR03803 family)